MTKIQTKGLFIDGHSDFASVEDRLGVTPKEIAACQYYVSNHCAWPEAWKSAFTAKYANDKNLQRAYTATYKKQRVQDYIKHLQNKTRELVNITAADLLLELEEARQVALDQLDPKVMVASTLGKAKILGLLEGVMPGDGGTRLPSPVVPVFNVAEATRDIVITKGK